MATNPILAAELRELYAKESARLKEEFAATREGSLFLVGRTKLVDSVVGKAWSEIISPDPEGPKDFALIALGGYGRKWLFPYSDIDLLFLHAGDKTEAKIKEPIRRFSQELWDLRLKLSPASRTLGECDRMDPENLEFAISLLDCRYLAGDQATFCAASRWRDTEAGGARVADISHAACRTCAQPAREVWRDIVSS